MIWMNDTSSDVILYFKTKIKEFDIKASIFQPEEIQIETNGSLTNARPWSK